MNGRDALPLDNQGGFAYRDMLGLDKWEAFTVSTLATVVGAPTYTGRYRIVGRSCEFQVSLIAATSIATTAGTSYVVLPIPAVGLAGIATMTNDNTNIAVGTCHISVSTSRCYLPSQAASADLFKVAGSYEIKD